MLPPARFVFRFLLSLVCCPRTCLSYDVVQSEPRINLPNDKAKALMERIQNAGTEVVEAKVCGGLMTWHLPGFSTFAICLNTLLAWLRSYFLFFSTKPGETLTETCSNSCA